MYTNIYKYKWKSHLHFKQAKKKNTRRIHLTLMRIAIIRKITTPRLGTPRAPGTVARSWPGERTGLGFVALHSQPPCRLGLGGSCQEGWQEEGSVHHQQGDDQKIHYQPSQELPQEGLSRSVPLGYSKESCNLWWRRWELQACALTPEPTKLLGQRSRNASCCVRLSEDIRRLTTRALYAGYLRICHHPQKATDDYCGWKLTSNCQIKL